jgi:hypothetical protein
MLNFVLRSFRTVFKLLLWLNLVVFTIGIPIVLVLNFGTGNDTDIGFFIVAMIISLPIGLLLTVALGGLIAVFLRIDENLKLLVKLDGGEPVEQLPKT